MKCPKCNDSVMIWMNDYDCEGDNIPAIISTYICPKCGHQEEIVEEINKEEIYERNT